jgi:hypothetical protein
LIGRVEGITVNVLGSYSRRELLPTCGQPAEVRFAAMSVCRVEGMSREAGSSSVAQVVKDLLYNDQIADNDKRINPDNKPAVSQR